MKTKMLIDGGNARFWEKLSINSHPSLQTQYYDGWLLRFSNGYTNRANSVNVLYPSYIDIEEKVRECEKRYAKHNLPCVFKIIEEKDAALDAILSDKGYQVITPTDQMIMDLGDKQFGTNHGIITEQLTDEWLEAFFLFHNHTNRDTCSTAGKMFEMIQNDTLYCRIEKEGKSIACASAVIENGYVTILNVIVDEKYRGKGYGRQLCESLLSEATKKGAHTTYLQVVQSNQIAKNLYEKLGYKKIYSYWYRKKK